MKFVIGAGIIFSLSCMCILLILRYGPVFEKNSVEKKLLGQNQYVGRIFSKEAKMKEKQLVDRQRLLRAAKILSNAKFDDMVVFLYNLVAYHRSYGYMSQIQFVDESANVFQINYRDVLHEPNDPGVYFWSVPEGEVSGKRYQGQYIQDMVLRSSDELTKATHRDVNSNEPPYLFLPTDMYENIISGKGEMLLLDDMGKVLDTLPLKKRSVPTKNFIRQ